jgi:phage gp36-like protein
VTTLYATVADLREALAATDNGVGTPYQLSDSQITQALTSASTRISVYAGNVFDSSTAEAVPPDIFHDLALDLGMFYAYTVYLKSKVMGPGHPVLLRYQAAVQMLNDVRDGKVRLDVVPPGGVGLDTGVVINRMPPIFTGDDSNTRLDLATGTLEPSTPAGQLDGRDLFGDFGPVYQG